MTGVSGNTFLVKSVFVFSSKYRSVTRL